MSQSLINFHEQIAVELNHFQLSQISELECLNNLMDIYTLQDSTLFITAITSRLHQFTMFYTSTPNSKTLFYHKCHNLFTQIFQQLPDGIFYLTKMVYLTTNQRYRKSILKHIVQIKSTNLPNQFQQFLTTLIFTGTSQKLQAIALTCYFQYYPPTYDHIPFLFSSSRLRKAASNNQLLSFISVQQLLKLFHTELFPKIIVEIQNRFDNINYDDMRCILHECGGLYKDSSFRERSTEMLTIVFSYFKPHILLFEMLDRFCDAPLVEIISEIILTHPIVTPSEYCGTSQLTFDTSEAQLFASAFLFQFGYDITIVLNEEQILQLLKSYKCMGMIELLLKGPHLLRTMRRQTYSIFQELMERKSRLYHGICDVVLIIQCASRLFPQEISYLVTDRLADIQSKPNWIEQQSGGFEDSLEHHAKYVVQPYYNTNSILTATETIPFIVDTFLNCSSSSIAQMYSKGIEEGYLIPCLASSDSIAPVIRVFVKHFIQDTLKLLPLIVNQFWKNNNLFIKALLSETIFELIQMESIVGIGELLQDTPIETGETVRKSLSTSKITNLFEFHFDFNVDSVLPHSLTLQISGKTKRSISDIIVKGILQLQYNSLLNDPLPLAMVIVEIVVRSSHHIPMLLKCEGNNEVLEEALMMALNMIINSNEVKRLRDVIRLLVKRKSINGKRIFLGILGIIHKGWNGKIGGIWLSILKDVTDWGLGWELLRAIGSVVLGIKKLNGDAEKERTKWLEYESDSRVDDLKFINKQQFGELYKILQTRSVEPD